MSYIGRLMEESSLPGVRPAAGDAPSPALEAGGVVEIEERIEVPPPPYVMRAPAPGAERPPAYGQAEAPTPVPMPLVPTFEAPAVREGPRTAAEDAFPLPVGMDPPFGQDVPPSVRVEEIAAEAPPPAQQEEPRAPTTKPAPEPLPRVAPQNPEEPLVRTLRTIEDVRRWVAAGPAAPGGLGGDDAAAPEALDLVFEPLGAFQSQPAAPERPRPEPEGRPEAAPEIQNVTLSIGRIDLVIEAPEAPPAAPSPAPAASPRPTGLPDTAAERLRRHYVNWPGGI